MQGDMPSESDSRGDRHRTVLYKSGSNASEQSDSERLAHDPELASQNGAWVEVDLPAVLSNARAVCDAAPAARLLAVVKANAYGLGAVEIAGTLEAIDPWGYAVATVAEAIALRQARLERPILVLRPPRPWM